MEIDTYNCDHKHQHLKKSFIHFASGGFALATAFAVMHPLDSLKTQIQANCAINLKNLTRGFFVSFLLAAPQGGLRLSTYEFSKGLLGKSQRGKEWGVTTCSAIAACAGDTVSSVVKVPREVITARLQSGMDAHELSSTHTKSPALQTCKIVIREQGFKGLFRGFWSTTARDWPFMIILFTTYESFKQNHHRFIPSSSFKSRNPDKYVEEEEISITTLKSTIFGGISGGLAGFLTTPFDVIKTNIMTHKEQGFAPNKSSDTPNSSKRSLSIANVGREIWSTGGSKAFFAGGGARSIWWFCVCSIFFPLYEGGKNILNVSSHGNEINGTKIEKSLNLK